MPDQLVDPRGQEMSRDQKLKQGMKDAFKDKSKLNEGQAAKKNTDYLQLLKDMAAGYGNPVGGGAGGANAVAQQAPQQMPAYLQQNAQQANQMEQARMQQAGYQPPPVSYGQPVGRPDMGLDQDKAARMRAAMQRQR